MKLYRRLFKYFDPYIFRFMQAGMCMVLVALLTTSVVWLIRTVVDDVLIARDTQKLLYIAALVPVMYLFKGVFSYIQNYLMNLISQSVVRDMRLELYTHLQRLSLDFYHRNSTGHLMSRITNDSNQLQSSITQYPFAIRDGWSLMFLLSTIISALKFAAVTLLLLPIAAVPVTLLGIKLRKAGRQIQSKMADVFMSVQEGIMGHVITKVFCREQDEIDRFKNENQDYYAASMRWVRADVLGAPIMEFIGSVAAVFLLWYGGKDVINGVWTTGSFFAFLGASISAYKPVKDFTSLNSKIQQGVACAERVFELIDAKPSVIEKKDAGTLKPFTKNIHYQRVGFAYDTGKTVLKDINLNINAGEVIAIVGPSGSGKTAHAAPAASL